jgi:hypothetical protein
MLASIAARSLGHPEGAKVGVWEKFSSHLRFDSLMAGAALALLMTAALPPNGSPEESKAVRPILPLPLMRFVVLPAVVLLLASVPGVVAEHVMMRQGFIALWMLSAVLVGFASLDRGYVLSLPVLSPILEYIGARSYALYLTHGMALRTVEGLRRVSPGFNTFLAKDADYDPWRITLAAFFAAFLMADVLHRAVERPFIRLGRALTDTSRAKPVTIPKPVRVGAAVAAGLLFLLYFRHPIELAIWPTNLALGKPVTASSRGEGRGPFSLLTNGDLEPAFGLHTKKEDHPWAVIDLEAPVPIGSIRVYNREDGYQDEQLPLEVQLSVDGTSYTTIASRDQVFTQSWPWRIHGGGAVARYIRLRVERESTLCLSEVEVFASEAPGYWP